jgi:putative Mg2+ transporter-C (MgtC) family protein
MEHLHAFFSSENIHLIIKIAISVFLGFLIGMERELTSKFAGLRTHILVCLGSTVFTILSIYTFPQVYVSAAHPAFGDPARIAAQILTGIGFIGAGTVMRHGSSVFGLTTAATLWITASIGMAIGAGEYMLGTVTAVLTVVILTVIRVLEQLFIRKIAIKTIKLKTTITVKPENTDKLVESINKNFKSICEFKCEKTDQKGALDKIIVVLNILSQNPIKEVHKKITSTAEVETIHIREVYPE